MPGVSVALIREGDVLLPWTRNRTNSIYWEHTLSPATWHKEGNCSPWESAAWWVPWASSARLSTLLRGQPKSSRGVVKPWFPRIRVLSSFLCHWASRNKEHPHLFFRMEQTTQWYFFVWGQYILRAVRSLHSADSSCWCSGWKVGTLLRDRRRTAIPLEPGRAVIMTKWISNFFLISHEELEG